MQVLLLELFYKKRNTGSGASRMKRVIDTIVWCFFVNVKMSKEEWFVSLAETVCIATLINFSPKKWKPAGDELDVGSGTLMHHCQHPVLHGISVAGATRHHQWDFARSHQKRMTSFFCAEPPSKSRSAVCVLAWHVCSPCIKEVAFICVW